MFDVNAGTNIVSLTRGDDATFTLHINQGSDFNPLQYVLKEKDRLYLAIEEPNQPFECAIVKKVIDLQNNLLDKNGNITFKLTPEDTMCLLPGLYYYEIKAKFYRGNKYQNGYDLITFNEDNTYQLVEQDTMTCLSEGTYEVNANTYILTDNSTKYSYIGTLQNNIISFNNPEASSIFKNIKYMQEKDIVNTIIQQTKFIVER